MLRKIPGKVRALAAVILAGAALLGALGFSIVRQKTPVELYVFDTCGGCNVQNPCKPCTVFLGLINEYTALLAQNGLRNAADLRPYNIYFDNDAAAYRSSLASLGLEAVPALPAVKVGKRILAGKDAVDQGLIGAVKEERRLFVLAARALGAHAGYREKARTGVYDEKTVVLFSLPLCEDCKRTSAFLKTLEGLRIVLIDPSDAEGRELYERYCETYGAALDDYAVPRLFVQNRALLGCEEAEKELPSLLEGPFKTIKIEVPPKETLIKSGFLNTIHGLHGLTRISGNKTLLIRENLC
jgi:glutaredoxin